MCPLKHFKIAKNRYPLISDDLINEIKQKDYLLKKDKKSNAPQDWKNARTARNNCLKNICSAKADFVKTELEQNRHDGRTFWQNIKDILPNRQQKTNMISLDDTNKNSKISVCKFP